MTRGMVVWITSFSSVTKHNFWTRRTERRRRLEGKRDGANGQVEGELTVESPSTKRAVAGSGGGGAEEGMPWTLWREQVSASQRPG
jgi:hypothetical protein